MSRQTNLIDKYKKSEVDELRQNLSTGTVVQPSLTDNGNGSIDLGAGEYRLFSDVDADGNINLYSIPGFTNETLVDFKTNYVIADYNGGSPITRVTQDVLEINETTIIPIYTLARQNSAIDIMHWDHLGKGLVNKGHAKDVKTKRFIKQTGLLLSEKPGRYVEVSAGIVWYGYTYNNLNAVDTSLPSDVIRHFYHSGGVWTTQEVDVWNNTQYDDGTDLQTLGNNKYVINYIWRTVDETQCCLYMVLSDQYDKLQDALDAGLPNNLHEIIRNLGIPIGKIITEQGSTAPIIQQVEETTFSASVAGKHNELLDLQGGTVNEYYHFMQSEHNDLVAQIPRFKNISSSAWLDGFVLSVNVGDPSKLDISAGTGIVVNNYTDTLNPDYTLVQFPGVIGLTIDNISTQQGTFFAVDKNGDIIQRPGLSNSEQRRDSFDIGAITHFDLATIGQVDSFAGTAGYDIAQALRDFQDITGLINANGNVYSASNANIQIQKSSGSVWGLNVNRASSKKNPHFKQTSAVNPAPFLDVWRDELGDWVVAAVPKFDINTSIYDDGTGTGTGPNGNLLPNKFSIARIYYSSDLDITFYYYGQNIYDTITGAKNNFQIESFETYPLLAGATFRAWLIYKSGATDLSDDTEAIFIPAGSFGGVGGSATTSVTPGVTVVHIDDTDSPYSIPPNVDIILADATNGAITTILPDSASDNEGRRTQVVLATNNNNLTITTAGGLQKIGGQTSQVITDADEAITVLSDYNNGSNSGYEIIQDSRAKTDATFHVHNAVDLTKELKLDVSAVSTATTRTLIIPDKNGTIALTNDNITKVSEFEFKFNSSKTTAYKEMTYTDSKLSQVDVWETSGKILKLYTMILSYTSDDLTQTITTDNITSQTLTKNLTYTSGELQTVTTTLS